MSVKLSAVVNFFEKEISLLHRQCSWDNSGKQVWLGEGEVNRIGLALDPTESNVLKAIKEGCELLITHHPVFFDGVKSIDVAETKARIVVEAVRNNLNILSYHTNLDLCDYSLSDYVATRLLANNDGILDILGGNSLFKVVVYVPCGYESVVLDAMCDAGCGSLGKYSDCSFRSKGIGTFQPMAGATPFLGEEDVLSEVGEYRLESIVAKDRLPSVIQSIKSSHPYEEPAYDIFALEGAFSEQYGIGTICSFDEGVRIGDFCEMVKDKLGLDSLNINTDETDTVFHKFAVVSGSGASYWRKCAELGLRVLLTGDLKHHDALDAYEAGVIIVDAGHFGTEQIYMDYLSDLMRDRFDVETVILDTNDRSIYRR